MTVKSTTNLNNNIIGIMYRRCNIHFSDQGGKKTFARSSPPGLEPCKAFYSPGWLKYILRRQYVIPIILLFKFVVLLTVVHLSDIPWTNVGGAQYYFHVLCSTVSERHYNTHKFKQYNLLSWSWHKPIHNISDNTQ